MRKLTHLDKKILISNQRTFELEDPKRKKAHFLWFKLTKLNKLAKKYDVELYAVPNVPKGSFKTYIFNYKNKKGEDAVYQPAYRTTTSIWSKDDNFLFKHLREGVGLLDKRIIVFIVLPYFDGGRIMRKNFYKETGPCAYLDFLVMNK